MINKILETSFAKDENDRSKLIFIYSNYVTFGVDIIENALIANGFLEYKQNKIYQFNKDTLDYKYGKKYNGDINFKPATFVSISGSDDVTVKNDILLNVFNTIWNIDAWIIKIIIGSPVMSEGMWLENILQIHIFDVHHNLSVLNQIVGRGIRQCKHYNLIMIL